MKANAMLGPRGLQAKIDSPAEALHVLVERDDMSRADGEQLTPILLVLRRTKEPGPDG